MALKQLPKPPFNPGVRDLVQRKRAAARALPEEAVKKGFSGWHENGYLPHRDEPGLIQFVTFRLSDAFPLELRGEWQHLLKIENDRKRRLELEKYLDRGRGECYLKMREIGAMVEESLLFYHGERYELCAWVVMPDHVHVLFRVTKIPMSQIMDAWKGYTAKAANKILRRKGQFWQDGYWDTYMRDELHEQRSRRYIENNPTKAGLVALPKDWQWTSSRFRDKYERLCVPPAKSGVRPSPGAAR